MFENFVASLESLFSLGFEGSKCTWVKKGRFVFFFFFFVLSPLVSGSALPTCLYFVANARLSNRPSFALPHAHNLHGMSRELCQDVPDPWGGVQSSRVKKRCSFSVLSSWKRMAAVKCKFSSLDFVKEFRRLLGQNRRKISRNRRKLAKNWLNIGEKEGFFVSRIRYGN